jgi:hypothetical protein
MVALARDAPPLSSPPMKHIRLLLGASSLISALAPACAFEHEPDSRDTAADLGRVAARSHEPSYIEPRYSANVEFYGDYPDCTADKGILVQLPPGPGPHPVLIYNPGTFEDYRGPLAKAILAEAVRQGFLAASIEYQNLNLPQYCGTGRGWHKVKCAYSTAQNPNSGVGSICSLNEADCSQGIVTVGLSQGGNLAALARNFDTRVRGAWTMGWVDRDIRVTHEACMDHGPGAFDTNQARLLANDRIRLFRGIHEIVPVPWGLDRVPAAWLNQSSGRSCGTYATSCLTGPNGSGWHKVLESEVNFAVNPVQHCFMMNNPLFLGAKQDCTAVGVTDPIWQSGAHPSGLKPNITWLKDTILPLGDQP